MISIVNIEFRPLPCNRLVCVLSTCGHNRGNRAPCAGRAISASLRPLDIHEYVFGSQSCINRLVLHRAHGCPDCDRVCHPGRVRRGRAGYRASPVFLVVAAVRRRPAPADTARHPRRDALSAGYRLLASLASAGVIREPQSAVSLRSASSSLPHLTSLAVRFFRSFCGGAFRAALVLRPPRDSRPLGLTQACWTMWREARSTPGRT